MVKRSLLYTLARTMMASALFAVSLNAAQINRSFSGKQQIETWITVFVHGIMSVKPHVSWSNIKRFIRDDVDNTVYSRTVELMRNDPFFFQNQAMQQPGLVKIDTTAIKPGNASCALSLMFDEIEKFTCPKRIQNHYYTFGWSGLMSPSHRAQEGKQFYEQLSQEIAKFRAQGIEPKVRIFGYSHGGNVCLNLARARQDGSFSPSHLSVDELILLGIPVQIETDYLVNDDMFKNIYHFYSRADRIQKLDFFSKKRFFSNRYFKERKDFKLPEKLRQIELKITRNRKNSAPTPANNLYDSRRKYDDSHVIMGSSPLLRNSSPGHSELWFFGWTPVHYRDSFPLAPLPTVSMIPYVIKSLQDLEADNKKPLIADIRPQQQIIILRGKGFHKVIPLLSEYKLDEIHQAIWQFAPPPPYSTEEYDNHIQTALKQAREEFILKNEKIGRFKKKKIY